MSEHPISNLLTISMNNIKDMIDVDTVVGKPIVINDNVSIIPISKVKTTFIAGGCDQGVKNIDKDEYPFGGATGGTLMITPIGFISINNQEVKLIHLDDATSLYERLIDQVPEMINTVKDIFSSKPYVQEVEIVDKKNKMLWAKSINS